MLPSVGLLEAAMLPVHQKYKKNDNDDNNKKIKSTKCLECLTGN